VIAGEVPDEVGLRCLCRLRDVPRPFPAGESPQPAAARPKAGCCLARSTSADPVTGPAELATLRDLIADGRSVTEAARILKIGRSTAYAAT
jgi:hypothetical protein